MDKTELRKRIDAIDDQILKLLNRRATFAKQTSRFKKTTYDPARERTILKRLTEANEGPLPNDAIRAVYREILSACRGLQAPVTVAYLGPKGSFSHAAAARQFGSAAGELSCSEIGGVFDEVEKGNADFGVVPVENSSEGVITATLDRLAESPLVVCGELMTRVELCLLSNTESKEKIKKVYTFVKPMEQCSNWLREQNPKWEITQVGSSAEAALMASGSATAGAIASKIAAEIYGLRVLEERIENSRNNVTRFFVIGKIRAKKTSGDKTSVVFSVRHEPGALYRALNSFERHKVNLTMIHSRPSRKESWEYLFFVDMNGHESDRNIRGALNEMRKHSTYVKIVGSYPEADRNSSK